VRCAYPGYRTGPRIGCGTTGNRQRPCPVAPGLTRGPATFHSPFFAFLRPFSSSRPSSREQGGIHQSQLRSPDKRLRGPRGISAREPRVRCAYPGYRTARNRLSLVDFPGNRKPEPGNRLLQPFRFSLRAFAPSRSSSRSQKKTARTVPGRFGVALTDGGQFVFDTASAVSSMRLEKPHSLSYQLSTLTSLPLTLVRVASKTDECGLWLKSTETSGPVL